jgi:hypothetical protein
MKFLLSMGYVNRKDLLYKALDSIKPYLEQTVVIDNSDLCDLRDDKHVKSLVTVYEPPIPLTFTQKMNFMQQKAKENNCEVVMYMHNDAEAKPSTPEALLSLIENLNREERKWGVIFTNFDILSAFNMEVVEKIGPWDTNLPQYFSDIDYYRRIRLAGYEHIWSDLPVDHHNNGMSTLKSDQYRKVVNEITWPLFERYYITKWGLKEWNRQVNQFEGYCTPFNIKELT